MLGRHLPSPITTLEHRATTLLTTHLTTLISHLRTLHALPHLLTSLFPSPSHAQLRSHNAATYAHLLLMHMSLLEQATGPGHAWYVEAEVRVLRRLRALRGVFVVRCGCDSSSINSGGGGGWGDVDGEMDGEGNGIGIGIGEEAAFWGFWALAVEVCEEMRRKRVGEALRVRAELEPRPEPQPQPQPQPELGQAPQPQLEKRVGKQQQTRKADPEGKGEREGGEGSDSSPLSSPTNQDTDPQDKEQEDFDVFTPTKMLTLVSTVIAFDELCIASWSRSLADDREQQQRECGGLGLGLGLGFEFEERVGELRAELEGVKGGEGW